MILAGITLYNPDIALLESNLNAVSGQVDGVVMCDNGSGNLRDVKKKVLSHFPRAHLIENGENLGIAAALNRIFLYAQENGFSWVLTLDQDSVCPDGMVSAFQRHMDTPRVGCLCPMVYDRAAQKMEGIPEGDVQEIRRCITSGAMSPVSAWEEAGGFCEEMFIDYVDFDFCARLLEHDYRILRLNGVVLNHSVGNATPHRLMSKRFFTLNHPPARKYYQIRNGIYYARAHRRVVRKREVALYVMNLFFKTMLYESDKWRKCKAMLAGVWDGFRMARRHKAR